MQAFQRHSDLFEAKDRGEFVMRQRVPTIVQMLLLFFFCFTIIYLIATNSALFGGNLVVALAVFVIIAPLCWFTVYFGQRSRDMLLAAEFQNALFSAAARIKSKFCIIVKQDGTVVYFDRGFQEYFPETANRGILMLDKILTGRHMQPAEAEKLYKALLDYRQESVIISLAHGSNPDMRMVVTIDPLPRPSGFILLRGREYVTKQYEKAGASADAVLASDSAASASLAHLLHTAPIGLYTTDTEGRLLFINYTLEGWLGFAQHQILGEQKSIDDLIPNLSQALHGHVLQHDAEGIIPFRKKDGTSLPLYVQQEIIRDEYGNITGSAALLRPSESAEASSPVPSPLFQRPASS